MKVVVVVDDITNLDRKINMLQSHFGDDMIFVVKAKFAKLYETYSYPTHAVYSDHLTEVLHYTLLRIGADNLVIYYTSLMPTEDLLNTFAKKMKHNRVINVIPRYNFFEKSYYSTYNLYVKGLFHVKDNLASPKLQYIPAEFCGWLLSTNFGNRMFDWGSEDVVNIYIEDKELSSSLKVKSKFNKYSIIPIISLLVITMMLLVTLAYVGVNYWVVLIFLGVYVVDILISIFFQYKKDFDIRFLK